MPLCTATLAPATSSLPSSGDPRAPASPSGRLGGAAAVQPDGARPVERMPLQRWPPPLPGAPERKRLPVSVTVTETNDHDGAGQRAGSRRRCRGRRRGPAARPRDAPREVSPPPGPQGRGPCTPAARGFLRGSSRASPAPVTCRGSLCHRRVLIRCATGGGRTREAGAPGAGNAEGETVLSRVFPLQRE